MLRSQIHGDRHLSDADEASAYLAGWPKPPFRPEVRAEQHVHTVEVEDVSRGIVDHITELRPDLIVMCTHGHGGLRDLIFGNIPQQVVGRGTVPVLLVQPGSDATSFRHSSGFSCRWTAPLSTSRVCR